MKILGAGLSGTLAGALSPASLLLEASPEPVDTHRAVLRFREDKIGRALGIPFRKVRVYKSIFFGGTHCTTPTPQLLNLYSRKVTGRYLPRSIGSLEPVDRFIAPEDFAAQLRALCAGRIQYGSEITSLSKTWIAYKPNAGVLHGKEAGILREGEVVISTLPLPTLLAALGEPVDNALFSYAPIYVARWRVPDCETFCTIYFPGEETPLYRASLTGDLLTLEGMQPLGAVDAGHACLALGLREPGVRLDSAIQRYGKIVELPAATRKGLLYSLTTRFNVFCLGRYGVWRNVLLDDVMDDFYRIRQMMGLHNYDLIKGIARNES